MGQNIFSNLSDLKTTIPALWASVLGLWVALGDVLGPFGIVLPHLGALPAWVPTALGVLATLGGSYIALFVKSHSSSGIANTINAPQKIQ